MPHARSQLRFGAALTSACLTLTLILTPTASPQSGATDILVVLKNQPARQILDSIASTSGTARRLAEDDFRRLSGQAGVPHPTKAAAAQRLLTQLYAQTREASAEIKAAIAPEQDLLAGRLTGLGATAIRHYSALNMLEAQIPDAALAAVQQDPAVAEVIPVGANQKLLDDIEQGLTDRTNFVLASIVDSASGDPAFLRLIDRIILLTGILTPSAYAQSDPPVMLIILKNQPISKIVQEVDSQSARWRKFAEHELRRAPAPMQAYMQQRLNAEFLAESDEVMARIDSKYDDIRRHHGSIIISC